MQELCSCIPEDLGNPDLRVKAVSDLVMNPTAFSPRCCLGGLKQQGKKPLDHRRPYSVICV